MIRVSTIARVGNHEVVRVRPFLRIAGNLSLTVSDLSANIPPFNPQRLLAEAANGGDVPDAPSAAAEPDAEVSFVMRDLAPMLPKLQDRGCRRRPMKCSRACAKRPTGAARVADASARSRPISPASSLPMPANGAADPYAGFEARIVPENITLLPKTDGADHRRQCSTAKRSSR